MFDLFHNNSHKFSLLMLVVVVVVVFVVVTVAVTLDRSHLIDQNGPVSNLYIIFYSASA